MTNGDREIILSTGTERVKTLRFSEIAVRPQGRGAAAVWAIHLADDDAVVSMDVVELEGQLLIVTAHGYGKWTPLSEYPAQSRYGGESVAKLKCTQTMVGLFFWVKVW